MCKAKPFPRCSNHAIRSLRVAQANHSKRPTAENQLKLQRAQKQFLITPAGIKMLERQGRNDLATRLQDYRSQATMNAKRWHKFSTELDSIDSRWLGDEKLRPKLTSHTILRAYTIAVIAHQNVNRKSGEPYINHPLRVAYRLSEQGYNDEVIAVAVLHDAIEDSDLTLADLRKLGFNERIVSGVDSVTKRAGEDYPDTIARASQHPIGQVVKLADNLDNSSSEQLRPFSPEKREKQIRKYTPARKTLLTAIKLSQESLELLKPHLGFLNESYRLKTAHRAL